MKPSNHPNSETASDLEEMLDRILDDFRMSIQGVESGGKPTITHDEVKSAINQHKLEWLENLLPENKPPLEPYTIADHWGLTATSTDRQLENMKNLGFNQAISEIRTAIKKMGGSDE